MRESEVIKLCPEVEREYGLPADKARSLCARVRRVEGLNNLFTELIARMMDDAQIAAEEAWDEIAKIGGFASLEDAQSQGFELAVVSGRVVQVRSRESSARTKSEPHNSAETDAVIDPMVSHKE